MLRPEPYRWRICYRAVRRANRSRYHWASKEWPAWMLTKAHSRCAGQNDANNDQQNNRSRPVEPFQCDFRGTAKNS